MARGYWMGANNAVSKFGLTWRWKAFNGSQRLEDANHEVALREARKAEQRRGEQPAPPPAVAKAKLNSLPAHMRLAAANGDRQLAHLIDPKKK